MKIVEGSFGRKPCANLAIDLRALADAVDRGEIVDLIAAYVRGDNYEFLYATSIEQSVVLASLLQQQAVNRMRG